MLCSPRELAISADHGGILVLPPATRPVGVDVAALFGLDDVVFDIEVKPNRPDLMSVAGVAREAAAATGRPVTPPETPCPRTASAPTEAATVRDRATWNAVRGTWQGDPWRHASGRRPCACRPG